MFYKILLALSLLTLPLSAQVTLGQSSAPNAAINYLSGLTAPVQAGAALPSTCPLGIGQLFFLTTGMPGQNVYACTSASPVVWTLEAGGGTTGVAPSQQFNVGYYPGSGTTSAIGGASTFQWCQTGSCGPNSTAAFISAGQPISSADSTVLAGVFNNPTVFNYNSSTTQSGYEFINGNFPIAAQAQAYGRGNGVDILTDCTSSAANGGCVSLNVVAISTGQAMIGAQITGMAGVAGIDVFAGNWVATDQNSRRTDSAGYQSFPSPFMNVVESDCIVSNPNTAICEGIRSESLNSVYPATGTFSAFVADADSSNYTGVPGFNIPYSVPWKIGFHCPPGGDQNCVYLGSTVRNNSGTISCANTGAGGAGVCTIVSSNEDFHKSFAGQQLSIVGSSCANSVCTIGSIGPASNTATMTTPTGSVTGAYAMYGKSSGLEAESYSSLYGAITYLANFDTNGNWNEGFTGTGFNGGYAWYGENQLLMNLKQVNSTTELFTLGQLGTQTGEFCIAASVASTFCQTERNLGVTAAYYHNVPLTGPATNNSVEVWKTTGNASNTWITPSGNGTIFMTGAGTFASLDGVAITPSGNLADIGGPPQIQITLTTTGCTGGGAATFVPSTGALCVPAITPSGSITLTTNMTSGLATLVGGVLNIPNYGAPASPMTTLGDMIYENATPTAVRLPGNTSATLAVLAQTGTGSVSAAPVWTALATLNVMTSLTMSAGSGPTFSGGVLNIPPSSGLAALPIQVGGMTVGNATTLDFESGTGIIQSCSAPAAGVLPCTPAIDSSVVLTKQTDQANTDRKINGTSGGAGGTFAATGNPTLTPVGYLQSQTFIFTPTDHGCTGADTVNIDGIGPLTLKKRVSGATVNIVPGDCAQGVPVEMIGYGSPPSAWLITPPGSADARGLVFTVGGTGTLTTASISQTITVPFACQVVGYDISFASGTALPATVTLELWHIANGTVVPTGASIATGLALSSGTSTGHIAVSPSSLNGFTMASALAIGYYDKLVAHVTAFTGSPSIATLTVECAPQ